MTDIYDFIKAWSKPGQFAGWFDISISPPINIHILVNIKDWGCAIGRLEDDKKTFIFSLPYEDSFTFLQRHINEITHWAIVPTIKNIDEYLIK